MAELLSFSFGGLTFLALSLHESLSPLLPVAPRHRLLLRHLIPLPICLIGLLLIPHLSSLFLLFSIAGLLSSLRLLPPLPSPLLDLLLLSSFLFELLLLRLLPLSPLHHHYLRFLSVPVLLCSATTLLSALRPRSPHPRLARALSLALHGTWLIQTAFSLFSSALARDCRLQRWSWMDFSVTCDNHAAYHRAMALATLQFNCHLALLVVTSVTVYWLAGSRTEDPRKYLPLEEVGRGSPRIRFALASEDEEEGVAGEGK